VLIDADRPDARRPDAPPLAVVARALGSRTNNYAEYTAVVLALRRAHELGADEVELVLDSKLVVEQLSGRWKVRHPAIRPLVDAAQAELAGFRRWSVRHEPRAANHAADALANLALDDPAAAAQAEERGEVPAAEDDQPHTIGRVAVGAACAIFDGQDRVLLVRHTYGRRNWELPGGLAHAGEAPSVAAQRELAEETGLQLEPGPLSGVYYEAAHEAGAALHFVFGFAWREGLTATARPPEIDAVAWASLERLPRPISDFTVRRITDALGEAIVYGIVEGARRDLD
jgi:8-oxo-dGTP diphosphatase